MYTLQIGVHWCHYLKSRSDLRVFSNWHPFQILRFMAIYCYQIFSGRRSVCAFTLSHDGCGSGLYIIYIAYYIYDIICIATKFREYIQSAWPMFRLQKISSATLLFKQAWKQNLIRHWMVSKVQNSKWLSSGCFQSVLCRFPCSILCLIFSICAAYK